MNILLAPSQDREIRRLARRNQGPWELVISGEVTASPWNQFDCKFFAKFSKDKEVCVILYQQQIIRQLVAAGTEVKSLPEPFVVWTLIHELRKAGGPYVEGVHGLGRFGTMPRPKVAAIPVVYTAPMFADSETSSPNAAMLRDVIASWSTLGIPMEVTEPTPVTTAELRFAHDKDYMADIMVDRGTNSFGDKSRADVDSLSYTCGAMLAAARQAIHNRAVAVAPCSGLHHAGHANGGSFCTFNWQVVVARVLHEAPHIRRVGILDFDSQLGDRIGNAIRTLDLRFIEHVATGKKWNRRQQAERFLRAIPEIMAPMRRCKVILFQANANPHVDDQLGGWLTNEQLTRRDRIVFETAHSIGVPLALNLAGGYQASLRQILDIHANSLRECWRVYGYMAEDIERLRITIVDAG